MKKLISIVLLTLLAACATAAEPSKVVTLYPSGAEMKERRILPAHDGNLLLELPSIISPDSLQVAVTDNQVISVSTVHTLNDVTESPHILELRKTVEKANADYIAITDQLSVIKAMITFWKSPQMRFSETSELQKAGNLMIQNLKDFYVQQAEATERQKKAQKALSLAEAALKEAASEKKKPVRQYVIHLSFPATAPTEVMLTYALQDCGWTPQRRIEAHPDKKSVCVTDLASVTQRTGTDWADAVLVLSTSRPSHQLVPAVLFSWVISEREAVTDEASAGNYAAVSAPRMMVSREVGRAPRQKTVSFSENATASSWNLGVRNLRSGEPLLLELDRQEWKADFVRLLRPSSQKVSFLTARVVAPKAVVLATARTQFSVDGTLVGESSFAFSGLSCDIHFGPDPAVTCEMILNGSTKGKEGFIDKDQTHSWNWTIEVSNAHKFPVSVRVEDPIPQSRNKEIVVTQKSDPVPQSIKKAYVWDFELSADSKKQLQHTVSLTAPLAMKVNLGR